MESVAIPLTRGAGCRFLALGEQVLKVLKLPLEQIILSLEARVLKLKLISAPFCLSELLLDDVDIALLIVSVFSSSLFILDLSKSR